MGAALTELFVAPGTILPKVRQSTDSTITKDGISKVSNDYLSWSWRKGQRYVGPWCGSHKVLSSIWCRILRGRPSK